MYIVAPYEQVGTYRGVAAPVRHHPQDGEAGDPAPPGREIFGAPRRRLSKNTVAASPSGAEPALADTRVVPLLARGGPMLLAKLSSGWSHLTGGRHT